jgi:DNA-binding FadR family transcriptional regulator
MSMTDASTTLGAVRRPEVALPRDEIARGRSPYPAISVTRSYEGVARQIAESIRNRQIHSGERLLTERELSFTFRVSRGVIREAIKVLGAPSLVEARQGSGTYVRNNVPPITRAFTFSDSPDAESIERLFEFRCTVEAGRAMADHIVYTENAVTQDILSSQTDAMVSHSSNERVA